MNRKPLLAAAVVLLLAVPACSSSSETKTASSSGAQVSTTLPNVEGLQDPFEYSDDDLAKMSPELFADLSLEQRLDYMGPKIDEWKNGAWDIIDSRIDSSQKLFMNNEFPADKSQYTNQQILNRFSIDYFDAASQGTSEEAKSKGLKLLDTIVGSDNPNLGDMENTVRSGYTIALYKDDPTTNYQNKGILRNTTLRGNKIGPGGARIIKAQNSSNGDSSTHLLMFEYVKTAKGNDTWIYRASYGIDDPSISSDAFAALQNSR